MEIKDLNKQKFENETNVLIDTICKFGMTMDELSDIHINLNENKNDLNKNKSD